MPVSKKTPVVPRRAATARPAPDSKAKAVAAAAKPTAANRSAAAKKAAAAKAVSRPAKAAAVKAPVPAGRKAAGKAPASARKPAPASKPAAKKPMAAKTTGAPRKPVAAKPAAKKPVAAKKAVTAKGPAPARKPAAKPAAVKKAAAPRRKEPPAPKPLPPPKPAPSPFTVGDKVVYPHHGAAVIARRERLVFQGQRTDYFVLEVATDQLILKVPVHKAVDQGVRPVISRTVARRVLATFKLPPEEAGANWSRWYKLLTEKINSGDIFQVAEVVRDLTYAQQTKGISPALKRMLSKARLILASELRFALDVSEEEAMRRLDKSLPRVEVPEEF